MPAPSSRLVPNDAEVAAKVMDGEAIMINLSNGMYYSMDGVGSLIWEQAAEGRSLAEIVATIVQTYDVAADRARVDLDQLVNELIAERLVSEAAAAAPPAPPVAMAVEIAERKLPYLAPQLNKYSDMGDLLALDPPMPGLRDMPWAEPAQEIRR